jgi:hypothetical protein
MARKRRRETLPSDWDARMDEVTGLIKAGRWHAPNFGDDADEGGTASPVRVKPRPDAGSGSVALPEPDEEDSGA